MIAAIFEYQFLQRALLACLLASIVCGIIGIVIIEKKLVMMCGGIAHASYGGVGLGFWLGFEPILGAFAFSLLAALGIGYLSRRGSGKSEVLSGLLWSLGMALGIVFISLMPGYPPNLGTYLFGNVLSVTGPELTLTLCLTVVVLLVFIIFYNYWKAYLFDEEFAAVVGVKCALLEYLLLILVAMAVVVLIRVVGIILILALLLAPAATAGLLSSDLKNRMIISVLLGWLYCFLGLWISYEADIASGASIVMVSVLFYLLYAAVCALRNKTGNRNSPAQDGSAG
ncbi:MAG: metal ABC transporter permease [Clostridiales bacterium]|nr:metal ABC transporter permease [Clostridiales bacterium]